MTFDKQKAPSQGSITVTAVSDDTNRAKSKGQQRGATRQVSDLITTATPAALLCAYSIFSIALYSLLASKANTAFWFVYLTAATLLSITTVLEAYDGLTSLHEGRKVRARFEYNDVAKPERQIEEELPEVECIFIGARDERRTHLSHWSNLMAQHQAGGNIRTTMLHDFDSLTQHLEGSAERKAPFIALFSSHELPHPTAVPLALQRLLKDQAIDIVQGRRILASRGHLSPFAVMATFQEDLHSALLYPGRCSIWDLPISTGSGSYWRTEALVAACTNLSSPLVSLQDLALSAYRDGTKSAFDLSLISYAISPTSIAELFNMRVDSATTLLHAAYRWSKLALLGNSGTTTKAKRTFKSRIGLLRCLPVEVLAAHMITQFLSLMLAQLIAQTPRSSPDVAHLVHWSSAYSQWMILSGVVAMTMLIVMTFKARSEFLSMWHLPFALLLYPVIPVLWACISIYGQLRFMIQGFR